MASDTMEEYFIQENRLASFTVPQPVAAKRRGSNASSRAPKALSWPHKSLKPIDVSYVPIAPFGVSSPRSTLANTCACP